MLKFSLRSVFTGLLIGIICCNCFSQQFLEVDQQPYWPTESASCVLGYQNYGSSPVVLSFSSGQEYSYLLDGVLWPGFDVFFIAIYWEVTVPAGKAYKVGIDFGPLTVGQHSLAANLACFGRTPLFGPSTTFHVAEPSVFDGCYLDFEDIVLPADGSACGDFGVKFYRGNNARAVTVADVAGDNAAMINPNTIRFFAPQLGSNFEVLSQQDCKLKVQVNYSSDDYGVFTDFDERDLTAGEIANISIYLPDHHCIEAIRLTSDNDSEIAITELACRGGYLLGDFNYDDKVDIFDFLIFKTYMGGHVQVYPPDYGPCDMDEDGDLDIFDFLIFKSCFGQWAIR